MTNPKAVATLASTLLSVSCFTTNEDPEEDVRRPNILFIYSDDHAVSALGAYEGGLIETPELDRLAREGVRFANCFVGNSICAPARATILTGLHSHAHGVTRNGLDFDGDQATFPKLLQASGYQTALIGKWHLKSEPTGFDHWEVLQGQGPYYNPELKSADGVRRMTGYTTEIITALAEEWLENGRDPMRPFLLMVQHKAPHRRWLPGPNELGLYNDVVMPQPPTLFDDYEGRASGAAAQEMTIGEHMSDEDLKLAPPNGLNQDQLARWNTAYARRNAAFEAAGLEGPALLEWKYQRYVKDYLRCVMGVDKSVGELLDWLDDHGLSADTVVVYSSDQGFYLGEHGWYDKRWMYEPSLRTPLIVRWPGVVQPHTVEERLAQNIDIAPTFLSMAGAAVPPSMHGESLVPLIQGAPVEEWRASIYYRYYEFPGVHAVPRHLGVRTERYKLIYYDELEEWELFDLRADPLELSNAIDEPAYADVVEDLREELDRLRKQYDDES